MSDINDLLDSITETNIDPHTTVSRDYILLDRSGSMAGVRWEKSVGSINTYVRELKNNNVTSIITVVAFDSDNPYEYVRQDVAISDWTDIAIDEIGPRGGTPLYDSTAKLINEAEAANAEKTMIVIVTDGGENSSREYTLENIKARIDDCKTKNWEVIFLGAEFNVERTAVDYGFDSTKTISTKDLNKLGASMSSVAFASAGYRSAPASVGAINLTSAKKKFKLEEKD